MAVSYHYHAALLALYASIGSAIINTAHGKDLRGDYHLVRRWRHTVFLVAVSFSYLQPITNESVSQQRQCCIIKANNKANGHEGRFAMMICKDCYELIVRSTK